MLRNDFDAWHRCHTHAMEAELFKLRRLAAKLKFYKTMQAHPPHPETWQALARVLDAHGQAAAASMGNYEYTP